MRYFLIFELVLQARLFAYPDAARYRLGVNNCPPMWPKRQSTATAVRCGHSPVHN
jgi:catalase